MKKSKFMTTTKSSQNEKNKSVYKCDGQMTPTIERHGGKKRKPISKDECV